MTCWIRESSQATNTTESATTSPQNKWNENLPAQSTRGPHVFAFLIIYAAREQFRRLRETNFSAFSSHESLVTSRRPPAAHPRPRLASLSLRPARRRRRHQPRQHMIDALGRLIQPRQPFRAIFDHRRFRDVEQSFAHLPVHFTD